MDIFTKHKRSEIMRHVKSKHTRPEVIVRRLLFSLGYRYRIHYTALPGSPDIVFTKRKKVIFIHGCFWHRHQGCRISKVPKSNTAYWLPKLERNASRDIAVVKVLRSLGWDVKVLWECQIKDKQALQNVVVSFLEEKGCEEDDVQK
jgi:DNA mismatch endonuclease, patch repair protein